MLALADYLQHRLLGIIGWAKYQFLERHRATTIQVTLVVACLALTLVSGVLMQRNPVFGFAAAAGMGGLLALLFIYRNLEITCLLLVVISNIFDFGLGTGTGTPIMLTVVLLLLILLVWLFKLLLVERSFKSVRASAPNRLVVLFCGCVVISFIWSGIYVEIPIRPMLEDKLNPRLMTSLIIMLSPISMLIIANHVRSFRAIKFFTWWFILFGGFMLLFWLSGVDAPPIINGGGQLGVWASLLALGQAAYNDKLHPLQRLGLFIIPLGWWYVQYGLGITWLSGWMPLAAGFAGFTFLYSRKIFVLLVVAAIVFVLMNSETFSALFEAENNESGQTRVEAWERTIRIVRDHYLFGSGPAGYYFYLQVYIEDFFQLSHNNYVDILAQMGVLGFAVFILLWLSIGWMVLKMYLTIPKSGFRRGLANSLVVCYGVTLLIMMLGDWVIPFPYTQTLAAISYTMWPWLLAGLAISLYYESVNQFQDDLTKPQSVAQNV